MLCRPSKAMPKVWLLNTFSPGSHLLEGRDKMCVDLGRRAVMRGAGLPSGDSGTPASR